MQYFPEYIIYAIGYLPNNNSAFSVLTPSGVIDIDDRTYEHFKSLSHMMPISDRDSHIYINLKEWCNFRYNATANNYGRVLASVNLIDQHSAYGALTEISLKPFYTKEHFNNLYVDLLAREALLG